MSDPHLSDPASLSRRAVFAVGMVAAATTAASAAQPAAIPRATAAADPTGLNAIRLEPNSPVDQSVAFQAALDQATQRGAALVLAAGHYRVGNIQLRAGARLAGSGAILSYNGAGTLLTGRDVTGVRLDGLTLDGNLLPLDEARGAALLALSGCRDVVLSDLHVRNAGHTGLRLERVSGRIHGCTIAGAKHVGLFSLDADGIDISHNSVSDCGDNGLLIWRSKHGEDGSIAAFNRIARIANVSGGTGQYGNGINIYRAGRVLASNNRITDCAYSAIRANEASNVQMLGNTVERIGEVALYAEAADERLGAAGFEGAVISNNVIDTAAGGIVVTNFNNGGRLAIVQGNLVRNLTRREHEKTDKRGEGIAVEADAMVSNNVIENAATCGIMIGWGRHMRDVVAAANIIRRSRIGIAVSGDAGAGQCLIANNLIVDARDGAVRSMDHARAVGPDLAAGKSPRNIIVVGNVAS